MLDEVHLLGRLALVDQHVSAEAVCAPKQRRQGRRELRIKKKKYYFRVSRTGKWLLVASIAQ